MVVELFNFQGWQLVDEFNCVVQGELCLGYIMLFVLVMVSGLEKMGDSNQFDLDILYWEVYVMIWGKQVFWNVGCQKQFLVVCVYQRI